MLFMIIERFKHHDPKPVYKRVLDRGRLMPEGVKYISSWVEANFERCFQIVEADDASLIQEWIFEWRDLVEFDVIPVVESAVAAELVNKHL